MTLAELHLAGTIDALQRRAGEAFEADYLRSRRGARVVDPRRDPVRVGNDWCGMMTAAAARRVDQARSLLTHEALQQLVAVVIRDELPVDRDLLRGALSVLAQRVYGLVVA